MSPWIQRAGAVYARLARAFPGEFRAVCGDGLEQLGEDVVPLVWREDGTVGLVRLFADLACRLPTEYISTWLHVIEEAAMDADLFEGTWKSNQQAQWDPKYTPEQACLRFEVTDDGYLLVAYGIKDGQAVAERPTKIAADGKRRPLVDLSGRPIPGVPPGAMATGSRPDRWTLEGRVEVDGKTLGAGTYRVSEDGKTLTVTSEGVGQKGPFKVVATFDRVVPDPYAAR